MFPAPRCISNAKRNLVEQVSLSQKPEYIAWELADVPVEPTSNICAFLNDTK